MGKSNRIKYGLLPALTVVISISLLIFTACGGSSGGGSDSTAPTISKEMVTAIGSTSCTITWQTNENADSKVEYGTTTGLGQNTANTDMVKSHSIQLTGLTAATKYYFKVVSKDKSDNESESGTFVVTTTTSGSVTINAAVLVNAATGGTVTDPVTGTTVTIPAGALSEDTMIMIGSTQGFTADSNAIDTPVYLGPDGTSFSAPVTVTKTYDENNLPNGLTEDDLYLVYSSNEGGTWTQQTTVADTDANTLSTQVSGFSLIGIAGVPTGDTTAPVISNIAVSNITTTSVTITWTTDESANSKVDYGATTAYGSDMSESAMVTSHSITLTGLTSNTVYHYQVSSADAAGNSASSVDATFTTAEEADTTAPVISGIIVSTATTSVTITWTTDEAATSAVDYGATASYGSTESDATLITSHSVTISGLTANTTYHFQIKSADAAGNTSTTSDSTFTTDAEADTTPPVISNIAVDPSSGYATITWTTDEAATSVVDYGLTASYGSTESNTILKTSHSIILNMLDPNTTYHYQIKSADAAGNTATTTDATLTTDQGLGLTQIQVTGLGTDTATITWTSTVPATSVINYGLTSSLGTTESDDTMVTSHSVTLTGLTAGTKYYYSVASTDGNEVTATVPGLTFTTLSALSITDVSVTGIGSDTATITWTTNNAADSAVNYGTTSAYGQTESDATMVTSHSVTLTGLSAETEYHYSVSSTDGSSNSASSPDATFTTLAAGDTTPPVISDVNVSEGTDSAEVTWTTNEPATSRVDFGLSSGYGQTALDSVLKTSHSLTLTGLTPETVYHYMITSADEAGNPASTTDDTFETEEDFTGLVNFLSVSVVTYTVTDIDINLGDDVEIPDEILEGGTFLVLSADISPVGISLAQGSQFTVGVEYPDESTIKYLDYIPNEDDDCTPGVDESTEYSGNYEKVIKITSNPQIGNYTFGAEGPGLNPMPTLEGDYLGFPLDPANLVSPSEGANTSTFVEFDWDEVTGAGYYAIAAAPTDTEYGEEACDGTPPEIPEGVFAQVILTGATEATPNQLLVLGKEYGWAVVVSDLLAYNYSISYGTFNTTSEGVLPASILSGNVTNSLGGGFTNVKVGYYQFDEQNPLEINIVESVGVDGGGYFEMELPAPTNPLVSLTFIAWVDDNGNGQIDREGVIIPVFTEDRSPALPVTFSSGTGWLVIDQPLETSVPVSLDISISGN